MITLCAFHESIPRGFANYFWCCSILVAISSCHLQRANLVHAVFDTNCLNCPRSFAFLSTPRLMPKIGNIFGKCSCFWPGFWKKFKRFTSTSSLCFATASWSFFIRPWDLIFCSCFEIHSLTGLETSFHSFISLALCSNSFFSTSFSLSQKFYYSCSSSSQHV